MMVPDDVIAAVDELRTALRDDPTELPVSAIAALHASGHDVTVTDPTDGPIVFVRRRPGDHLTELTDRELEVAAAVAAGLSNRQIAMSLRITLHTVKDHVHSILTKLGLASRTQLVAVWFGHDA